MFALVLLSRHHVSRPVYGSVPTSSAMRCSTNLRTAPPEAAVPRTGPPQPD